MIMQKNVNKVMLMVSPDTIEKNKLKRITPPIGLGYIAAVQ